MSIIVPNTIKLYKGEEHGVVIETEDFDKSMFYAQYNKAYDILKDMMERNWDIISKGETTITMTPNIIAFCGDRGEGKTSCMESFTQKIMYDGTLSLAFMDLIDPAFFDNDHNVVELILGLLYKNFFEKEKENEKHKEEWDKEEFDKKTALTQELSTLFQRARLCLRNMAEGKERMFDPLEQLSVMMSGMSLHERIEELFAKYLKWCDDKECLIIRIDDIDLNMEGAYEMLENLRIYLNNPRCIILMSAKIDQLQKVVAEGLTKQMKDPEKFDANAMALRYIIKVIPIGRQVNMPKVYDVCNKKLEIYSSRYDGNPQKYLSVKDAVVRMIFIKTRFLFYNSKGSVSLIIPNNLRSLRHLIGMLDGMLDFIDRKTSSENMQAFIYYLFHTWTEQLEKEHRLFAARLVGEQNLIELNKIVVHYLAQYISDEKKQEDYKDIVNPSVANYNVSVGDVMAVLDFLDKITTEHTLKMLLFFVRSFYSIKLFEAYDVLTDEVRNPKNVKENVGEIYRTDQLFKQTSLLQRIINGAYFAYIPGDLLPRMSDGKQARDYKVIDGKKLNELIREVDKGIKNSYKSNVYPPQDFIQKFKLAEYYALCVRRFVASDQTDNFYRKDKDDAIPFHLTSFSGQNYYYVFDALMPFVTVTDVKAAYNRFVRIDEGKWYEFALNHEWSLLRQMMDHVRKKEIEEEFEEWQGKTVEDFKGEDFEYPKCRLLSNGSIRNAEVHSAVFEGIKSRRFANYGSSNRKALCKFYLDIVNSRMSTYEKEANKENSYVIKFSFLEAFADLLNEVSDADFDAIFVMPSQESKKSTFNSKEVTDPVLLKINVNQNTMWARKTFAKLEYKGDDIYTGAVVKMDLKEKCPEWYVRLAPEAWNKMFYDKRQHKGNTVFKKLGEMRHLLESKDGK